MRFHDKYNYSGDTDGRVPFTSSRYALSTLKLPLQTAWRPWYSNTEVITITYFINKVTSKCGTNKITYILLYIELKIRLTHFPYGVGWQVGGYVAGYEGLTLATIRGSGHMVPSYQPQRALTFISSFLQGKLPPTS